MNINACIYDKDGNLVGCVTDSVLAQFQNELEGLCSAYGNDASLAGILAKLAGMCNVSCEKCSAEFLNCLKILLREYNGQLPIEFLQSVSRAYHNLLRHCCSGIVRDEVLNATIAEFRENGIEYLGTLEKINGKDSYAFLYNDVHVSICMVDKSDLYGFWSRKPGDTVEALISFNGKNVLICSIDGPRLCDGIKACVDDLKDDADDSHCECCDDVMDLAKVLIEVAKTLLGNEKTDD